MACRAAIRYAVAIPAGFVPIRRRELARHSVPTSRAPFSEGATDVEQNQVRLPDKN